MPYQVALALVLVSEVHSLVLYSLDWPDGGWGVCNIVGVGRSGIKWNYCIDLCAAREIVERVMGGRRASGKPPLGNFP
jgi:hypothetical protein